MATSNEGAKAPFLNDYKLEFFWRRFPQTLTGGLRLNIGAPFYIYLYQVVIFLWPVFLGGLFTALTEYDYIQDYISCIVYGSLLTLCLICVHLLRLFWTTSTRNPIRDVHVLSDEDEADFISCFDRETFHFIFPAKSNLFYILFHGISSGMVCGLALHHLLPSSVRMVYNDTATITLCCIFGWLSLCVANFSLMVQPPAETAVFRPMGNSNWTALTRPFYVAIISLIGVFARYYSELSEVNEVLYIIMAFLPLLWVIGILPPIDALFSWLVEQLLVFALGGTYYTSDLRIHIAFLISGILLVPASFITNYTSLVIYSALFGFLLSVDVFHVVNKLSNIVHCTKSTIINIAKHIIIFIVTVAVAGITSHFSDEATITMFDAFGYLFIILFVVMKVIGDSQYVYILGGLIRNPLYIKNTTTISGLKQFQAKMTYVGHIYNILLTYVCPFLLVAFLSLFLNTSNNVEQFWIALGSIRAFRRVWQDTWRSMIEVNILCIIQWCKFRSQWWNDLGVGSQLLVIAFIYDRCIKVLEKALFMFTMFITAWIEPKQRHRITLPTLIISLICFPILLLILLVSAALSAPLLPLFCFPIFLIGFPRPKRTWPSPNAQSSSASEGAVFYQQLVPKVCERLEKFVAKGTILHNTDFMLVRYQDRFIVIQVLEIGYKYCTIIARGLELQETSCHTVEATTVDDMFEEVFCKDRSTSFGMNQHILNTLTPTDCFLVDTYSDAHNVLTGVIDQPENIQRQSDNFIKCLVWLLLDHQIDNKYNGDTSREGPSLETTNTAVHTEPVGNEVIDLNSSSKESLVKQEPPLQMVKPSSTATTVQVGNRDHQGDDDWSDMEWSDDDDQEDTSYEIPRNTTATTMSFGLPAQDIGGDQMFQRTFGLPAQDTSINKVPDTTMFPGHKTVPSTNMSQDTSNLKPPYLWAHLLQSAKRRLSEIQINFPEEWCQFLIKTLQLSDESCVDNRTLPDIYKDIAKTCFAIVNVFGLHGTIVQAGSAHIQKVFSNIIPWSPELDILEQNDELKTIVLQAFRYAFKLTYDEAVLGQIESEEELLDTLKDYKENWFIGVESDSAWNEAILNEKANLFSIGFDKDKGTYTSHVLTKQELVLYTGRLNNEAMYGQWASLAMELLYLTNDDEERYSIQAHPMLLRNLTIQTADPPLGYAVFSSGPVHISHGLI